MDNLTLVYKMKTPIQCQTKRTKKKLAGIKKQVEREQRQEHYRNLFNVGAINA